MEVINVRSLSKHFKDIKAVENLSFSVNEADVYGFLGQNGAGKSTTIRMLLTLIEPTHGSIEIFGKDLNSHRASILREVGAVIERPDLYKYLTAFENLSIFARLSEAKLNKSQLMEQLDMVGLAARAHSKVHTFSQGMKQRLGLAVALVHNPKLIMLDEPTNGLDPQGIADIRKLILFLSREKKKTILVSSHLLSEIEQIATRMLIIDRGKKIVEGDVKELFDPSRMLIDLKTTDNSEAISKIAVTRWNEFVQTANEKSIVFKMKQDIVPQLSRALIEMNIEILSIQPRHSLEEYFLSLTSANSHVDHSSN
ncbi:MAG: bacitracin ABC transporter ATP-binding protein [Bacteroidetes bacterium]|nr:MAG: bacitracin ABC transporter ATP-binding protein [Bacteroidota bacterium]